MISLFGKDPLEKHIQGVFLQYAYLRGFDQRDIVHIPAQAYMGSTRSQGARFAIGKAIGGLPDLTFYKRDREGRIRVLFIELKKSTGKPRPNQLKRAERWHETKFCYTLDEAKAALDEFIVECEK